MVQAQPSETSQVQKMEYTQLDSGDNPGCKISNRVLQYSQILKICSFFNLSSTNIITQIVAIKYSLIWTIWHIMDPSTF
jgi:hypothetical protein